MVWAIFFPECVPVGFADLEKRGLTHEKKKSDQCAPTRCVKGENGWKVSGASSATLVGQKRARRFLFGKKASKRKKRGEK